MTTCYPHERCLQTLRKPRITALVVLVLALLAGCQARGSSSLSLPAEPPLSGGMGWALVQSAYAPLRASPDKNGVQSDMLRRGEIRRIVESRFDAAGSEEGGTWYLIAPSDSEREGKSDASGWLHSTDIVLYPNEARAKNARETVQ